MQEIWDALESTTVNQAGPGIDRRATASKGETIRHRDALLRFLEELDGDMSVSELREALEEYR